MTRTPSSLIPVVLLTIILLAAISPPAASDTTTVNTLGFTWVPPSIVIQLGDTVHWHRNAGSHTVTSGTGFADPNVGLFFNSPLNLLNPDFYFTFGVSAGTDTTGVYPYHCTPHEIFGMLGTITVEDADVGVPAPVFSETTWGELKGLFTEE